MHVSILYKDMDFKKWFKGKEKPKLTVKATFFPGVENDNVWQILRHLDTYVDAIHIQGEGYTTISIFPLNAKDTKEVVEDYKNGRGSASKKVADGFTNAKNTVSYLRRYWRQRHVKSLTVEIFYSDGQNSEKVASWSYGGGDGGDNGGGGGRPPTGQPPIGPSHAKERDPYILSAGTLN